MTFDRASYDESRYGRRVRILTKMLGGKCVGCASEVNLHFDHIDPKTKLFSITKCIGRPMAELIEEVKKCQLLCEDCHRSKSADENSVPHGGGISGKKNCKCVPCRNKYNHYLREWRRKNRWR